MSRNMDLTKGSITGSMLLFALPMIAGNLLQQCYNLADTFIVGRCLGPEALAAVGSSYSLMTFLLSLVIGLCMGSSTLFSMRFGNGDIPGLKKAVFTSFLLIGVITIAVTAVTFAFIDPIIGLLQVPAEVHDDMRDYLVIICAGIPFTFLYNFYAFLLRSVGDSVSPLWFLGVSVVLNIGLDLALILGAGAGTAGAALATVISQALSATGLIWWTRRKYSWLHTSRKDMKTDRAEIKAISSYSLLTCMQQSVMNFGILMVQGLVNSFGTAVMAAFATAVKIDAFAYMPLQEFGNAFRGRETGAYQKRHPQCSAYRDRFFSTDFRRHRHSRPDAHGHIRRSRPDGSHIRRDKVSQDRGKFLHRDRLPVHALRTVPGYGKAWILTCAYSHLPGSQGIGFICPGPVMRSGMDMVGNPYRVGRR